MLDHEQSHVMNRDRGLLNRLGGIFNDNPTSEASLYKAAMDKMADAAGRPISSSEPRSTRRSC